MTSQGDGHLSANAHKAFLEKYKLTEADVPLLTMSRSLTSLFAPGKKFGDAGGDPTGTDRGPGWMTRPPFQFGEWWEG